jgi:hypothetical protein
MQFAKVRQHELLKKSGVERRIFITQIAKIQRHELLNVGGDILLEFPNAVCKTSST